VNEYICLSYNPIMKKIIPISVFSHILILCPIVSSQIFAQGKQAHLKGNLIIFHAGSLSVPMKEITKEFNKVYPDVKVQLEAAGSVASARKITDLDRPCDILASADYSVINKMLIPRYADWNLKFAGNEMAIVYQPQSRYASKINSRNWYEILLKPDVAYGRADPNSDPCGYRTVMMLQLASKYYKNEVLAKSIIEKNQEHIRPKEVDLLALLESGSIDYIFLYRSVAIQHKLNYIVLPDAINLKNPAFASQYATVKVEINGTIPGEKQVMIGEPMIYGLTIPRDAPDKSIAEIYVAFMLSKDKGMKIFAKDGQPSIIPMAVQNYNKLPLVLRPFAKKE
jgi:molybdate/tungstate transport system substrate-binding protein